MTTYSTQNPIGSTDPRDLYDNAENLDDAVNSDSDTFQDRLGKSRLTWAGIVKAGSGDPAIAVDAAARAEAAASQVQQDAEQIAHDAAQQAAQQAAADVVDAVDGAVSEAQGYAQQAEVAAGAATANADVYPDIATGIAAVVDGEQFQVVEGEEIVRYQRTGPTTAVPVARALSAKGVLNRVTGALSSPSMQASNPNLFTLEQVAALGNGGMSNLVPRLRDGVPVWSARSAAPWGPFNREQFPSGLVSAAVNVIGTEDANPGTDRVRFILSQYDEAGDEIMSARVENTVYVEALSPGFLEIEGAPLHGDCETLALLIGMNSSTPSLLYREMLICDGSDASFRVDVTPTGYVNTEELEEAVSRSAVYDWSYNSVPDSIYLSKIGWLGTADAFEFDIIGGRNAIKVLTSDIATQQQSPLIDISGYKTGVLSASFVLESKSVTANASDARMRVRFFAADGITGVAVSGETDDPSQSYAGYITKYLPTEAVDVPTYTVLCREIPIPAGAVYVRIGARYAASVPEFVVSQLVVRDGADPQNNQPPSQSGASLSVVRVGAGSAYSTINEGLDALGGAGTIILEHSREYGSEMRIDPTKCRGDVNIIGVLDRIYRPRILLAPAVTGLEQVSGETRIWRFPFSTVAYTPDHVWIHDLPDASTAIPLDERMPQHDGDLFRLPSTRIKKLEQASLALALDDMRSSDDPLCFYDSGWLYVTGPDGMNLDGADIRVDSATGLCTSVALNTAASIKITNVEVMYGGANLRAFNSQELYNFTAIGSRGNCVDWIGSLRFSRLRLAGGWNWSNPTGDGLNGHNNGHMEGSWLYCHDNKDDGESTHENGSGVIWEALFEDNGGSATATANGAAIMYIGALSRRNQRAGAKAGAFFSAGTPSGGASGDPGFDTIAKFIRCRSVGDVKGFFDQSATTGGRTRAICEDCSVEEQIGDGPAFDVYEVSNCSTRNVPGAAKAAHTIVRSAGDKVV